MYAVKKNLSDVKISVKNILLDLKSEKHIRFSLTVFELKVYLKISNCCFIVFFKEKINFFFWLMKRGKNSAVPLYKLHGTLIFV